MDLLQLTLARLPTQRLLELYVSEVDVSGESRSVLQNGFSIPRRESSNRVISIQLLTRRIETIYSADKERPIPREDEFKKFDDENRPCAVSEFPASSALDPPMSSLPQTSCPLAGAIWRDDPPESVSPILDPSHGFPGFQRKRRLIIPSWVIAMGQSNGLPYAQNPQPQAMNSYAESSIVNTPKPGLTTPSTNIADYFRMLTLAGELTTESQLYVRMDALMERALFLRDSAAFYYYAGIYPFYVYKDVDFEEPIQTFSNRPFIQRVLETADPKIISVALALAVNTKHVSNLFPIDWKSIEWTPGLRNYYEGLCRSCFTSAVARDQDLSAAAGLAGHLQIWSLKSGLRQLPHLLARYIRHYVNAYLETERMKPSDPAPLIRILLENFQTQGEWRMQGLRILPSGTLFDFEDPLIDALEEVLPEMVVEFLADDELSGEDELSEEDEHPLKLREFITHTLVKNAHRMLVILTPKIAQKYGIPLGYLSYLRVVCGLPIAREEILDMLESDSSCIYEVLGAMIAVMHPDLSPEYLDYYLISKVPFSTIHYAPRHFVEISEESLTDETANIAYRYGLGRRCQGAADCRISSAHARRGPVGRFANPSEVRSVEEIINIEKITKTVLPNRERLLENARAFKEHVQIFYELLSR